MGRMDAEELEEGTESAGGSARAPRIFRAFYPVLASEALGAKPRPVRLWGRDYVLFRDAEGRACALRDVCPHRNVPLSLGRCVEGRLECAYHGWQFDGDGRCVRIPALVHPLRKNFSADAFSTRERHGLVWLRPSGETELVDPDVRSWSGESGYTTVVREVRARGSLHAVAENALDVPHTSVLHRGLFRTGERHAITGHVTRDNHSIEIEYRGEPAPKGLAAWLLALRGGDGAVEHFDRFFLPGIVQVEYRLGSATHFVITGFLSPVDDEDTKLFAIASFRTPLPGALLGRLLLPLALRVFAQDARILAAQSRVLREQGGERFVSSEVDVMGPAIARLLRGASKAESVRASGTLEKGALRRGTFELLA